MYYNIGTMLSALLALSLSSSGVGSSPTFSERSSGCGQPHSSGFNDNPDTHSVISGGITRTYAVYVPQNYNDNSDSPRKLIIDYHGNGDTPKNQYDNSRYFAYPDGEAYLAVYPAGVNRSWQGAPYAVQGVDDLQFTTDLLSHLSQAYCIDQDHVYASGKSNGGGFVDLLACSDAGDAFAAFAMASAALYSDTKLDACSRKRAIIESHGTNDTVIPYTGGVKFNHELPDIQQWISWWGQRDGCDPNKDKDVSGDKGGYQTISYSCSGFDKVAQHYEIYGLGHCWPSTEDNSDSERSYCKNQKLDYTPIVLDFFAQWDLGNAPRSSRSNW